MSNYFKKSYEILSDILKDKAYINIALNNRLEKDGKDNNLITKIVYGITEKDSELEVKINRYLNSRAKPNIMIILKIALYCSLYLDSIPPYAIVNNAVDLSKSVNRGFYTGLVNAVTRKLVTGEIEKNEDLSCPEWLKTKLIEQYGEDSANQILTVRKDNPEHIRNNLRLYPYDELIKSLNDKKIKYSISPVGGIFVKKDEFITELFNKGYITFQSPSSMLAVKSMGAKDGDNILDICSAPGGKAVYLSELCKKSEITAYDIHPHRLFLIRKYYERMKADNIKTMLADATKLNNNFIGIFDAVLCDVPCSGSGVIHKKPDILLNKADLDLTGITDLQHKIISTASKYVKNGGTLLYSTCSILKEENDGIIDRFLNENKDFKTEKIDSVSEIIKKDNNGRIQLLPDENWDGFFISKLRRI